MRAVLLGFLATWLCGLQTPLRVPLPPGDALTPAERVRLEAEPDIEDRIKLYEAASTRHLRSVQALIKGEDFEKLSQVLQDWTVRVVASREDVERFIQRKKKSRALIRYEIHIRKAIGDLDDLKLKLPADAEEARSAWVDKAEEARKCFVDILFAS